MLLRLLPLLPGLLLAVALLAALEVRPGSHALRLDEASLVLAPGEPGQTEMRLPHAWRSGCVDCATLWYQFDFDLPALTDRPRAVYLEAVGQNAALYLNGEFIGQAAPFGMGRPRMQDRPLLFTPDPSLWRSSGNTLFVVVQATPWQRGFLSPLWLGEQASLLPWYRIQLALRQTVPLFLGVATLVIGLVLALVWANRRGAKEYAWLALAGIAWSLAQAQATLGFAPIPAPAWDALTAGAAGVVAVAMLHGLPTFSGQAGTARWRALGRIAWAVPALMAVAATLAPGSQWESAAWWVFCVILLGLALVLARAARDEAGSRRYFSLAPAVALGVVAVAELIELPAGPGPGAALRLALPFVVIAVSARALQHFIESLQVAELLNIDLDRLVRERTAALEKQFSRVRSLEQAQAVALERERLMRDMHDGLGGHLVSTLAMLERSGQHDGAVAAAIRNALDDMRLLIDSLDPVEGDLNAVLAMFRDRIQPRLQAAGIRLDWDVRDLPELPSLGPSGVLSILRVLQECVTNAIKHAAARTIGISARPSPDGREVTLAVTDDGRGFDKDELRAGRGLLNMRRRAAAAGGELRLESGAKGTVVSLVLCAGESVPAAGSATVDRPRNDGA